MGEEKREEEWKLEAWRSRALYRLVLSVSVCLSVGDGGGDNNKAKARRWDRGERVQGSQGGMGGFRGGQPWSRRPDCLCPVEMDR